MRLVGVVLLGLTGAGCVPDAKPTASLASRATVAFDSIDGPPPGIFQKLVRNLNEEAELRRVSVVSRDDPSQYRVRGYLSAHVAKGRTSIAWVWDVYDLEQRRALRITGEEPGTRKGDAWASADDEMLQQIARKGMDQLTAFLNSPEAAEQVRVANAAPEEATVFSIAGVFDSPEAAGIFRVFSPGGKVDPISTAGPTLPAPNEIPLPPHHPDEAALPPAAALGFAAPLP